jgi:HSP20 family protein
MSNQKNQEDIVMAIVRRFNNQVPDIANIFDDFFGGDFFDTPARRTSVPAVNITETDDEYVIEVAAPGMKKDDFKVEIDNGVLSISAEVEEKDEQKDEAKGYTRREFSYSSFNRSFTIPKDEVDESKIDAKYKDGLLRITLQKRDEVKPKPARMIEIK